MDELMPRPPAPRSPLERARAWLDWFGLGRALVVSVSIALVGAGGYWLVAPPPAPVETSLPMTAGAATTVSGADPPSGSPAAGTPTTPTTPTSAGEPARGASTTAAQPDELVVHVAGAVVTPGVYRLPVTARVADAVVAAGGVAGDAFADAINLAAPLRDGDRVYVPRLGDAVEVPAGVTNAAPPPGEEATTDPGPVSINDATAEQLDTLPGIGPATAAAIVAHREQHGPFTTVDGLADVRGIGPAKLEAIRPLVTL